MLFKIQGKKQINRMISIQNGGVFINQVETVNPELIGLAVLDYAENGGNPFEKVELMKYEAIQDYLETRGINDESVNDKIRELKKLNS